MGQVLGHCVDPVTGLRLEPDGSGSVLVSADSPGELGVGHIPGQGMPEEVLVLSGNR